MKFREMARLPACRPTSSGSTGLAEAIMWARVNPFSPLHDGKRFYQKIE